MGADAATACLPGVSPAAFDAAARHAGIVLDAAQREAVTRLTSPARRHAYLHGPAGRGKTWLMDAAYAAARTDRKRRFHFHDFFPALHAAIFRHGHDLDAAIDELLTSPGGATGATVELLCFDEFHVHDVADGVLVRRLLEALAARPVRMIVTSNYAPEQLLPHPLFHDTFLPAIALIRRTFDVVGLDGGRDHREHGAHTAGFAAGAWIVDAAAAEAGDAASAGVTVRSDGRDVRIRAMDGRALRATFADLCEQPLGASDYARLAELCDRWAVTGVPPLDTLTAAPAQRFANLVDIASDRGVAVRFHAAGEVDALARGPFPPLDVARTLSRLRSLRGGRAA